MLDIGEFKDILGLGELPEGDYETVAGLILDRLGRIPAIADSFEWGGHRFEVVDMDGNRIDKVLVASVPPPEPGDRP
ncbi:MAG: transporter associated domain-containing protein [Isosphaeraceae bacterium]